MATGIATAPASNCLEQLAISAKLCDNRLKLQNYEQIHIVFTRRHYRDGVHGFLSAARNHHNHVDAGSAEECKVVHRAKRIGII